MMTASRFLSFLYGAGILIVLYFIVKQIFSVYYTPGSYAVYDSPITQTLFPSEKRLQPTWGTTSMGMMKADPTKYGPADFWPESGQRYVPDKKGSGGPSPSGGERSVGVNHPVVLREGYDPLPTVRNIYADDAEIPEKKVWSVGWWGVEG